MLKIIIIYLLTATNVALLSQTGSMDYLNKQFDFYPNEQAALEHPKLKSYISNPDTVNLQVLYGWGKDLGLKMPKVGFWIADTLLSLGLSSNDHRAIISAHSLKAQMYMQMGDYLNTIKSFQKAIYHGEENLDYSEHPNFDKLGINYAYLGDLYIKLNDVSKAKENFEKSWEILKVIDNELIAREDSINAKLYRDYTTYEWDKLYSQMNLAIVNWLSAKTHSDSIDAYNQLNLVYESPNNRDAQIKLKTALYLVDSKIALNDSLAIPFLVDNYQKSKFSGIFEIQAKLGLKMYNYIDVLDNYSEENLLLELLEVANRIEASDVKVSIYKLLSNLYIKSNTSLALSLLDSAYQVRELYTSKERLQELGKAQSDFEYQKTVEESKLKEKLSQERFLYALVIAVILLLILLVIIKLLIDRKRNLQELEQKNLTIVQQNIRLDELVDSKDKILGIISHDLRNPIKEFRLMSKDSLDSNLSSEELRRRLEYQVKSSMEIETLLNGLLSYADNEVNRNELSKEKIDIKAALDAVITLNQNLIKNKSLKFDISLDEDNVVFNIDIFNLVIRNVINNAAKFSPTNGTISISSHKEDDFIILQIQDHGMGMTKEQIEKLDQFLPPKVNEPINASKGSGFGLLTSKENFEKAGGNLYIDSEPDQGTTVLLYF